MAFPVGDERRSVSIPVETKKWGRTPSRCYTRLPRFPLDAAIARLPRYVIPGQPQHILQRGNDRQAIFVAEADSSFFRDALLEAANKNGLAIHAYVWMTSHIHLLATPESGESIGKVFQSVGRRYVQYFNFSHRRSGTLREGRYRSTGVDRERYLLTLMRYIELNPVRAGMLESLTDDSWSSHRRNALGESGSNAHWITPHDEYLRFGRNPEHRQSADRRSFRAAISGSDLAQIRECSHEGWALGGERFKQRIEALSQRRAASGGVGRPARDRNGV